MTLEKQKKISHGVPQKTRKVVQIIFYVPLSPIKGMRHELVFLKAAKAPVCKAKLKDPKRESRKPVKRPLQKTG